jgi:acetamidase/formamidase
MCAGDDRNCPEFDLHRKRLLDDLDAERRSFLKGAFAVTGGAAALTAGNALLSTPATAQTAGARQGRPSHHYLPATADTVHWGYFSKLLRPAVEVNSGDYVTIESLTHHANDDAERMIKGDPGAESVYLWTKDKKGVNRRGAGPIEGNLLKRGAGEGFGVHICTGPVYVRNAEPGDILEVRIMDVKPRPSANPAYAGKAFGSNAAAWWGFHYKELITEPKPREVITIFEIDATGQRNWAKAVYNYRWTPQTDPFGVVHNTIDYPGVPVDHATVKENHGILKNVRIPIRPHFGVIGVAPKEADVVDSIPPGYFGGNIDNWRIGKGATMYYPVAVPGALLSVGDSHASQGDSELCGTAIECSLTGTFQLIVHKKASLEGTSLAELTHPLLETQDEWVLHGFSFANYLQELGPTAQQTIYEKSSVDLALKDAFRKMRAFLMTTKGLTEDEAIALISIAVDFGVTQVVDGNWGVHAIIKKSLFAGAEA